MPLRLIVVAGMFLCSLSGSAQQSYTDSVYNDLQHRSLPDTNRVKTLNNYARVIRHDSVDKALVFVNEAIQLARALKDEYWLGESFSTIAMIDNKTGDYQQALTYLDSAQQLFTKLKKYDALIVCLGQKAFIYHEQGKYSEEIDLQYETIRIAEKTSNVYEAAKGYGEIANLYFGVGMYNEAVRMYDNAYLKFIQLNDNVLAGLCKANAGQAYLLLKQYDKAIAKFDSAITMYKLADRDDAIASLNGSLGLTMGYLGKYEAGLNLVESSIAEMEKRKYKRSIIQGSLNAAKIIMLGMDSIKSDRFTYANALKYAEKAYPLAKESGDIKNQIYAMEILSDLYERSGKFKDALELGKKFTLLKDSVLSSQKIQEVAIKDAQFENEKNTAVLNAEHTAAIAKQKTIRNFSIGGIALVALASMLLFRQYKRRRDAKTKQQEAELKAQVAETENKVMRLQMNPHFIFNSLNSISDYIRKNDIEEADSYLAKFAKVMRTALESSELKEVPLSEDLKALELYMQLEATRLGNKFTYEIKVADAIDAENTLIPPLILQPFVENSIWHGIASKEGNGHINVHILKEGDMLKCIIDDDGIGRNKAAEATAPIGKASLGMKITKARIDMLNRLKGSNAGISLTDKANGLTAELRLPLETAF